MEQRWQPVEGEARIGEEPKEEDLRVEGRDRSLGTEALLPLARPAPWPRGAVHLPGPASHSPGLSSAIGPAGDARPLAVKVSLPPTTALGTALLRTRNEGLGKWCICQRILFLSDTGN